MFKDLFFIYVSRHGKLAIFDSAAFIFWGSFLQKRSPKKKRKTVLVIMIDFVWIVFYFEKVTARR